MESTLINIDNLKCGGCANSIRNGILKIKGVEKVVVKEETSEVEILHNGENERATFLKKLSKMGYPEAGTTTKLQTAKSYVSCAIGRLS